MQYKMLINGELVDGAVLEVVNPATGGVFARAARVDLTQLEAAVDAADAAFPAWSETPIAERRAVLAAMASVIEPEQDALARLLTQEQGKPIHESRIEVGGVLYLLNYYANADIPVEVLEDSATRRVELHRRPLGVVAAIVPWNFPLFMAVMKFGAAMLAGNTVVLKPAPTTPLSTLELGRLVQKAVPPGVLNIIAATNDLAPALAAHPKVRKVSFTGSVGTGKRVMASSADTLKRVTLELGGNDPGIVLPGSDVQKIAGSIFDAAFGNAGQICVALKRLYVHDSLYDAMCAALSELADAATLGDGLEQGTQIGPVQNQMQYNKLLAVIAQAAVDGRVIAGGGAKEGPGYFVRPTIVRDIADGAPLVDEEQFGPVLPVVRYADLDAVIARINASPYGLGGSVWGPDEQRAVEVADKIEAGTVWINQHGDTGPSIPFAGARMSGVGAEHGVDGLAGLTQIKVVNCRKTVV